MLKLGIIGATGYVGAEIVRLIALRKDIEIATVVSNTFAGRPYSSVYQSLRGIFDKTCEPLDIDEISDKADFFITALPHGVSGEVVPKLLSKGKRVIDNSGDFRFRDIKVYEQWYKVQHKSPYLAENAVYGLPEINREKIKTASLTAVPGCYPTCSILAIAPALANKIASPKGIIIDAVSGVSGAGRKSDLYYSYCETEGNYKVYGLANHRHTPEIEQELSLLAGQEVLVSFTPHLAPMKRGMMVTCYLDLIEDDLKTCDILEIYNDYYKNDPFVRILPEGIQPETRNVVGSNFVDIGVTVVHRLNKLIIVSALDNLGKGAAGQAVQVLNIMAGFDETEGLLNPSMYI